MKASLDHLPEKKQRELARVVDILLEEFEDALAGGSADFKKKGRILKIILFGSYARGNWVEEPHTKKGYRSDYDLLIVVNNRKLTDFAAFWEKAQDRLLHDRGVKTLTNFIVHSRREVNTFLREGQYFFVDIRSEGIVLYESDDEPLATPRHRTLNETLRIAQEHIDDRLPTAKAFHETFRYALERGWKKLAAFQLHQAVENAYSASLLVLTNYGPPSHNLKFLRGLAESKDRRLADAWPRDQHRYTAWFNRLNDAYVKARYSKHYEISEEALVWLGERTAHLHQLVELVCREHLERLKRRAEQG